MSVSVETRRTGNVGEIVFRHPEHNHANLELLSRVADALDAFDTDPEVRAVVLASDGKAFCAGADFAADANLGGPSSRPVVRFYRQAIRIFGSKKPIVVAVQGAAIGAGLGLALAGDFRVAADEARFAANFVKIGFHPGFAMTLTLPRLVGEQRAAHMMLTGERYRAADVLPWGLVDEVTTLDAVRPRAHALAARIAENGPLALLATRKTMRGDLAHAAMQALAKELRAQSRLRRTEDHQEGIRAVAERRAGRFVGR